MNDNLRPPLPSTGILPSFTLRAVSLCRGGRHLGTWIALASGWFGTCPTHATTIINDGQETTINAAVEDIEVRDGPGPAVDATTVNLVDGAVIAAVPEQDPALPNEGRSIGLFENSILNMSGGQAEGSLEVADQAVANISGGTIGNDVSLTGDARLELSGAGMIDDDVNVAGNATWVMSGGEVGDQFFVDGSATVTLTPTAGPINDDLFIRENARLEMNGSSLGDELFVQGNATAVITGGVIDDDLNANDDAVITVSSVQLEDSIDTSDNGVVNFNGGVVNGGLEAVDSSVINVAGGTFENIFSDGEVALAAGGTINITGGTFGTAGASDDEAIVGSSLSGTLTFENAIIAGVADRTAPTATVSAALNGLTTLANVDFGDLNLQARNGGRVTATSFNAASLGVTTLGGGTVEIDGGSAEELSVSAELSGEVQLSGGDFGDISVELLSDSMMTIAGTSFTYNGIPVEDLNDVLDPDAFNEETGELRPIAGDVAGLLLDGSPFSLTYSRQFGNIGGTGQARLFLIPEPTSATAALLAALGLIALVRRPKG
jgi:hypothetical protein